MSYLLEWPLQPDTGGFWHQLWTKLVITVADEAFYDGAPLGGGWMHEEWHRAVMTRHHVKSYNGIYDFAGGNFTSVSREKDEDLARMKDGNNPDFVRLSAAGMESEHVLALEIERDSFFDHTATWNGAQLLLGTYGPYGYLDECAGKSADEDTAKFNAREKTIAERDFTGLDCNAWAYDLFHEDEKYAARGPHPSGVGIDRYRDWSDLQGEPQHYLEAQKHLEALSFIDPFILGFKGFGSESGVRWNANMKHYLASFGYAIDGNLFLHTARVNGLFTLHNYWNHERYFPGIEARTFGWKLPVETDVRAMAWLQPKNQRFYTGSATPGGLLDVTVGPRLANGVRPYGELVAKSEGWVAGNVYLKRNLSVQLGLSLLTL
jgi:hypothetical protein